jgi:hypothetical protein
MQALIAPKVDPEIRRTLLADIRLLRSCEIVASASGRKIYPALKFFSVTSLTAAT